MSILIKSPVEFNEELHRYSLGDKRLMGITGLIHSVLELGVYPDASEYTEDHLIPRAGSKGTAVHRAIQIYDELGIKQTVQIIHTRYGCKKRNNIHYVDEVWEIADELENYIRHCKGFRPLANEYTVSDNFQYASQIDNVWVRESTGGIWLADTKTNNLNYYPLDGYGIPNYFSSRDGALKEYLSWQLSIYAVLFERQNPGLKVEGLCANWLRKDDAAFWIIERKPDEAVLELLKAVWYESFDGSIVYEHPNRSALHPQLGQRPTSDAESIIPEDMIAYVCKLLKQKQHIDAELDRLKPLLKGAMEQRGMRAWDSGLFKTTIGADTERKTFDTKRFEKEYPELAAQYYFKKPVKGSFTIKLKDNSDD